MFITGYAFAKTILMLYSLLRFVLQQNDFYENQFILRITWEAFYISNMIITVSISSILTSEVMSSHPQFNSQKKNESIELFVDFFIGKANGTHRT